MLRAANKPVLANAIWMMVGFGELQRVKGVQYVIDGGYLLTASLGPKDTKRLASSMRTIWKRGMEKQL